MHQRERLYFAKHGGTEGVVIFLPRTGHWGIRLTDTLPCASLPGLLPILQYTIGGLPRRALMVSFSDRRKSSEDILKLLSDYGEDETNIV